MIYKCEFRCCIVRAQVVFKEKNPYTNLFCFGALEIFRSLNERNNFRRCKSIILGVASQGLCQLEKDSTRTAGSNKDNSFLEEYAFIMERNKKIAREFAQALLDYRKKNVNSRNLDLSQLHDPKRIYCYLRSHHWKKGIPGEFAVNWIGMNNTNYDLIASDIEDFKAIFGELDLSEVILPNTLSLPKGDGKTPARASSKKSSVVPLGMSSVSDFNCFKEWISKKIDEIENLLG